MFRSWTHMTVACLAMTLAASGVFHGEALAQSNFFSGQFYFVHGLPGDDLDTDMIDFPNTLPVDVCIGPPGALNCIYAGVPFGDFRGPVVLTQGSYVVTVAPANPDNPGTNPPIISGNITVRPRQSFTFVAHLSPDGTPMGTAFSNADDRIASTKSRVVVRHVANAGPVDVNIASLIGFPGTSALGIRNPQQSGPVDLMAGPYLITMTPAAQTEPNLVTPLPQVLSPANGYFIYAVGSVENETLQFLVQRVPLKRKLLP